MLAALLSLPLRADDSPAATTLIARPGLFESLTEPPCSYCSTENRKGFITPNDRVIAWVRGQHNGGAIPLRHFIAAPRVINDTYGLFFYDPDGGYVSAFKKDYGYEFHGWRGGVMLVKGRDGTLWSALTGIGLDGPQKGKRLERIPSMMTDWGYWLMLGITMLFGFWLCGKVADDLRVHDHEGIVWDEMVGMWITLWLVPEGWQWLLAGFLVFRFFDILKPWPIRWVDRHVHGGVGIMLDDVLAGVFAWLAMQGLVWMFA